MSKETRANAWSRMKKIIREHFFSGLIVLGPVLIVVIVFQFIFGGLLDWIEEVPLQLAFQGESPNAVGFFRILFFLIILLGGVLGISLLGLISRLYFGKTLFRILKEVIEKIPFFGAIYSSVNQLFTAISPGGEQQFSRVVLVEYPRKEVWVVAFVTGPVKGVPALEPGYISIYVPTVPNPTSGFHLMVKEAEVRESGLKVDEAFKLILSLGVAVPGGNVRGG